MKIIVKKTNEMSHLEKLKICNLFFNVFSIEKNITNFIDQFEKTDLGYSYFCLIYDDDNLVGSYSAIPEISQGTLENAQGSCSKIINKHKGIA